MTTNFGASEETTVLSLDRLNYTHQLIHRITYIQVIEV